MEDNNSKSVEKLVTQSKKLREACRLKHNLEVILSALTRCNNIAMLSKKRKLFNTKVLKTSYKAASSSLPNSPQTLVMTVENVSDKFTFTSEHWQFCINLNDETHVTWSLGKSLGPGQTDKFCCPLNNLKYNRPLLKVNISLQFTIQYGSKTYSKTFQAQEGVIDVLHCLDPGRMGPEETNLGFSPVADVDFSRDPFKTEVSFPPITKFIVKMDSTLRKIFTREVLLRDSLHRGFESEIDSLEKQSEVTVFYSGFEINLSFSAKNDFVAVKCSNPALLCAVKAAILIRLASLPGILVEMLDDKDKEKLECLKYKIESFQCDNSSTDDAIDVDDLMELYEELRYISESIRFSVVQLID